MTIDLSAQLDRLEAEGVLDVDSVDVGLRRPDAVRVRLAPALDYFARVELEVERNLLEIAAFLPHADDTTRRFVRVWSAQELPHGHVFERVIAELDLPPAVPDLTSVSPALRVAGALSRVPGVADVLLFLYLGIGAMHERLTATGYDKLRQRLLDLGERGLVETAIGPIRRQEAGHFAYYRNAALVVRDRLSTWQLHLARIVRTREYHPIGATSQANTRSFARTAVLLAGRTDLDEFAVPVQRVAEELLIRGDQGVRIPHFVGRALRESVEMLGDEASSLLRRTAGQDALRWSGDGARVAV